MTMTNLWPSPLPGPAWQKWRNCWDHLGAVTLADVPTTTVQAVRALPAVRQAEDRAISMAHSGDTQATNSACNALVRAFTAALKAHPQAVAA